MKNRSKARFLSFVLAAAMLLGVVPVSATDAEEPVMPPEETVEDTSVAPYASSLIASYGVGVSKASGYLTCTFYIVAPNTVDDIGATAVYVQKKNSSGSWVPYKTYYYSSTTLLAYNTSQFSTTLHVTSAISGTYKVIIDFYSAKNGTSDKRTVSSETITL